MQSRFYKNFTMTHTTCANISAFMSYFQITMTTKAVSTGHNVSSVTDAPKF